MTRTIAAALASLALAGCQTTSAADLSQREVALTLAAPGEPAGIAACLASTLGHLGAPAIYPGPADTVVIAFTIDATTTASFTVTRDGLILGRKASRITPFHIKRAAPCLGV